MRVHTVIEQHGGEGGNDRTGGKLRCALGQPGAIWKTIVLARHVLVRAVQRRSFLEHAFGRVLG